MLLCISILLYIFIGYLNLFFTLNIINPYPTDFILYDVGFQLLPELSPVYIDAIIILMYLIFFIRWWFHDHDILTRFYLLNSLLLFIRLFTFTLTITPPCIKNCISKRDDKIIWMSIYFSQGCNDHMFSGHAVHITLFFLYTIHYSKSIYEKYYMYLVYFPCLVLIIATKLHYTVDVIIGVVLTFFVFYIDYYGLFIDKICYFYYLQLV